MTYWVRFVISPYSSLPGRAFSCLNPAGTESTVPGVSATGGPRINAVFAKARKGTFCVISHNKPSPARAPPVARSLVFGPALLLCDQALNKLGPFLL